MSAKKFRIFVALAVLLGLGLRVAQLGLRPMHTDEAVKACRIFRPLWEGGVYRYDPDEHHGPTLAYATLLWGKLTLARDFARWSEDRFRGLTVVFGLGLILLLPLARDGLGVNATLAAAFLTAVSPLMVYYSRDYIHEPLLVFFTFLALAAGWRYWRTRKIKWMLLAGAAIGLMQSTKETFVFNVAAAAGAGLLNWLFARRLAKGRTAQRVPTTHLVAGIAAWVVVSALLFTSFLSHPSGLLDAVKTYVDWSGRAAGGSAHVHGAAFYWRRLLWFHEAGGPIWSEGFILALALAAVWAVLARREIPGAEIGCVRFLLFYTFLLAAIYTALPYKTPWCALGFWHGMILLAGAGAAALYAALRAPGFKLAAAIIFLTGAGHLAFQAWESDVAYAADQRAPWTYAQTSPDLLNLAAKVEDLAQVAPEGHGVRMNIIAPEDDYYPLPWYLRYFNQAAWWAEVPGYSKFSTDQFDAGFMAARLRGRVGPVSSYLMESVFAKYPEFTPTNLYMSQHDLETFLLTNLNQILCGPCIYAPDRFHGILLSSNTVEMLGQNLEGQDLIRLNRMLLEDAYTNDISRNLPPEDMYPPITIVSSQLEPDIDTKKAGKMAGYFALRPGIFLELYVQTNLWEAYRQHAAK